MLEHKTTEVIYNLHKAATYNKDGKVYFQAIRLGLEFFEGWKGADEKEKRNNI